MEYPVVDKIKNLCFEIKDKGEIGIIPYLEIGNINIKNKEYSFNRKASIKGCKLAKKDDVLISRVRPTRGAIITVKEEKLCVSNAFTVLRPINPICSKIIWYFLAWNQNFLSHLGENCTGSLYPTVNDNIILNYTIPLPPLGEQKRIVEKLDTILPKVKSAKARLEKIPAILKKFRQSVLAAACSGRLTEDWREGKDLPIWESVNIERLVGSLKNDIRTGPFGTSLKKSEHQKSGVPVWGIESIGFNGEFVNFNKIFVSLEKAKELHSFEVKGGDIIISRSGTVGELCILPEDICYGLISTNLMKISLNRNVILPKYFCWLFEGAQEVIESMRELCSGSTRLFLTQTILKELIFPLPPIPEQIEIVRRVEKHLALANSLESKYKKAMVSIEKIEQAVLAKAFRGELVEADPNEEPAEELLKIILTEKAKLESKSPKRRKKRGN